MANSFMYEAGVDGNRRDPGFSARTSDDTVEDTTSEGAYDWLAVARDAYTTSEDYFDANIRKKVERNLSHFGSRHAPGSKYYSKGYQHRARGFRPKTRSVERQNETAAAVALFSTADVLDVTPQNDNDESQRVSAKINQFLLQYRLTNTIPWFQTTMGAYQDTLVSGVAISYQSWDYREVEVEEPFLHMETGEPAIDEEGEMVMGTSSQVIADTCKVDLRPIENVLFSTSSDWRDPINTSPFLIDRLTMTVDEVKDMADQTNKTRIPWHELTDQELLTGVTTDYDPVRNEREERREDSTDQRYITSGFETVWVHRNFIRKDGVDWVFYTLGVYHLLSDPIPVIEEYPWLKPGQRPYVLGVSSIESHKNYPESVVGLIAPLQQEANDISNQRRDNVALVLNRRYLVKRGANIDTQSLMRNVPGGVVISDNPTTDIRIEAPPEVTGSSYQEQDRVNLDLDDLSGAFSTSSVASNQQLNETVGGMTLMNETSNSVTEYQLRIFVETWVEPVLKQLVQLEQYYETDEALLSNAAEDLQLWNKYGINDIQDQMLQGNMTVEVNVGFGATNPQQRVNKITMGLNTILTFAPQMGARLDGEQVATEILGALGYRGVERFFPAEGEGENAQPQQQPDPQLQIEQFKAQTQMQLEEVRAQQDQQRLQLEMQLKQAEMQAKMAMQERDLQVKQMVAEYELQGDMLDLSSKKEITLEQIKAKLGEVSIKERGANERFLAEKNFALTAGGGRGL